MLKNRQENVEKIVYEMISAPIMKNGSSKSIQKSRNQMRQNEAIFHCKLVILSQLFLSE